MESETACSTVRHSLPIPKMYPEQNKATPTKIPDSPASANTTPSSGFMQPWLNSSKMNMLPTHQTSPANTQGTGTVFPTPPKPSSTMLPQINMMHPIYMYSSPYFQYPPNMMYPYSSLVSSQMLPTPSQANEIKPASPKTSPSSPKMPECPKVPTYSALSSAIPPTHSYSHLSTTPVHEQISRGDRRSSLSSEGSTSPVNTSVNVAIDTTVETDTSVDCPVSDSDISRGTDSGNSSMGSEPAPTPKAEVKKVVAQPSPEFMYKKKARTNYTPEQVRGLEKVFLETPYPEPEAMEKLSQDLDIPEQKLKVWFQNKRARWRRRVQDNKLPLAAATVPSMYMPSMVSPYGFMPQPAMSHAPPMMANPYYPYQPTPSHAFNSPMQKFGFPCIY